MNEKQYICRYPNSETRKVTYKEIKDHNLAIIEDNYFFGLVHSESYSQKEVNDYYNTARKEQKARMKKIRENPDIVLVWNQTHEMYELEEEQKGED